jgi:hypothetical protein
VVVAATHKVARNKTPGGMLFLMLSARFCFREALSCADGFQQSALVAPRPGWALEIARLARNGLQTNETHILD